MLSQRDKKIKRFAEKFLLKSTHPDYLFCAVLVKSNKIISYGINRKSPKPFYVASGVGEIFLHAEVDCLHMVDRDILDNTTLYIIAKSKAGNYIKTKPCTSCMKQIEKSGIKRIVYQEIDGSLIRIKV